MPNTSTKSCKQCGTNGTGNFCNHCGQAYLIKRLTIVGIIQEIFHFFSHLDKGFLFTLKSLIVSPGEAQRQYVEGHRIKYQKPFSMFFLCATISGLIYYWTNLTLLRYFNAGSEEEASFFHQYMVILQVVLCPVYSLTTYVFFSKSKYNYAETFILVLYNLSLILIVTALLQSLKFIWPTFETRYLEVPIVLFYNFLTNLRFYKGEQKKWLIYLMTTLSSVACFLIAGWLQDYLIKII